MVKKSFLLIALFLIFVVVSPRQATSAPKQAAPPAAATVPVQPGWKAEWNKTVAAAKQEGKVVIFATVVKNTQNDLINAFVKEFGIQPEFRIMSGAEFATQVSTKRRAGIFTTDLFMGGMTTPYTQFKPTGILNPLKDLLILPEVTDAGKWYNNRIPFLDKDNTILAFGAVTQSYITINTDMVKASEITGYRDLIDPKWKGQIVINDPTIAGRGLDWFQVMDKIMGPDYVAKLLAQEPVVTRDRRIQAEWVARGKYPLGIALDTSAVQAFIKNKAPIRFIWPKEGVMISAEKGGLAVFKPAPHPNAARVFANWLLTKEAQTIWSRDEGLQSGRTDVPVDFLPSDQVRDPNKKYDSMDHEDWYISKNKYKEQATQTFSHFIK